MGQPQLSGSDRSQADDRRREYYCSACLTWTPHVCALCHLCPECHAHIYAERGA